MLSISKPSSNTVQDDSPTDLPDVRPGRYATDIFTSWAHTLAITPHDMRPDVFCNICKDGGGWIAKGGPVNDIGDILHALALRYGLLDALDQ